MINLYILLKIFYIGFFACCSIENKKNQMIPRDFDKYEKKETKDNDYEDPLVQILLNNQKDDVDIDTSNSNNLHISPLNRNNNNNNIIPQNTLSPNNYLNSLLNINYSSNKLNTNGNNFNNNIQNTLDSNNSKNNKNLYFDVYSNINNTEQNFDIMSDSVDKNSGLENFQCIVTSLNNPQVFLPELSVPSISKDKRNKRTFSQMQQESINTNQNTILNTNQTVFTNPNKKRKLNNSLESLPQFNILLKEVLDDKLTNAYYSVFCTEAPTIVEHNSVQNYIINATNALLFNDKVYCNQFFGNKIYKFFNKYYKFMEESYKDFNNPERIGSDEIRRETLLLLVLLHIPNYIISENINNLLTDDLLEELWESISTKVKLKNIIFITSLFSIGRNMNQWIKFMKKKYWNEFKVPELYLDNNQTKHDDMYIFDYSYYNINVPSLMYYVNFNNYELIIPVLNFLSSKFDLFNKKLYRWKKIHLFTEFVNNIKIKLVENYEKISFDDYKSTIDNNLKLLNLKSLLIMLLDDFESTPLLKRFLRCEFMKEKIFYDNIYRPINYHLIKNNFFKLKQLFCKSFVYSFSYFWKSKPTVVSTDEENTMVKKNIRLLNDHFEVFKSEIYDKCSYLYMSPSEFGYFYFMCIFLTDLDKTEPGYVSLGFEYLNDISINDKYMKFFITSLKKINSFALNDRNRNIFRAYKPFSIGLNYILGNILDFCDHIRSLIKSKIVHPYEVKPFIDFIFECNKSYSMLLNKNINSIQRLVQDIDKKSSKSVVNIIVINSIPNNKNNKN